MLPAARLKQACPRCRLQAWQYIEQSILGLPPRLPSHPSARLGSSKRKLQSRRQFSITRSFFQDAQPDSTVRTDNEVEKTVRQAKQTFGDTLPPNFLNDEEYKLYKRLYGPPLRETQPEDVLLPPSQPYEVVSNFCASDATPHITAEDIQSELQRLNASEAADGGSDLATADHGLETQNIGRDEAAGAYMGERVTHPDVLVMQSTGDPQADYINAIANNDREHQALTKLKEDMEKAATQARELEEKEDMERAIAQASKGEERLSEEINPEEEDFDDEELDIDPEETFRDGARNTLTEAVYNARFHPLSVVGKFKTFPSTLELPLPEFVGPIGKLLKRTHWKHIREVAEKQMGGRFLPLSPATPSMNKNAQMTALPIQAGHRHMSEIEADVFMATIMPGICATATSTLVEVRKRLGAEWIRQLITRPGGGPRVLDAGGAGAGLAAWESVMRAEWDMLFEKGEVFGKMPTQKKGERVVVIGSDTLRGRVAGFLHDTTFIPRLPDHLHSTQSVERLLDRPDVLRSGKTYDIIIASHNLMALSEQYRRDDLVKNLWLQLNPNGGVIIFLEKGHPRGFEAVAHARQLILDNLIIPPGREDDSEAIGFETLHQREPGMIVAPCTNHTKCPMYHAPGLSRGRKDFCHFSQRFARPNFLQKVVGSSSQRNHEDIDFSFVAVQRGRHPKPAAVFEDISQPLAHGKAATDAAFAGYGDAEQPPHPLSLPRTMMHPLKRQRHVTIDVCTPAGTFERWTIPKSYGRQAYHDARKARWGDLWALGAKSRVPRNVRLGREEGDDATATPDRAREGKKRRPKVINVLAGADGKPRVMGGRGDAATDRKAGRKSKTRLALDELAEMEEVQGDPMFDELRRRMN
jgi:ribosomal protein RSM22 (predicted rRNA methylase)